MKKIYTLFMVIAIALTANAQLVFLENFSGYTNGPLGTQGLWVQNGSGTDVQVASALPLLYTGYTSGTQYVTVTNTDGTDPHKLFSTAIPTTSNRFIFMSFVVRVTSAPESPNNNTFSISLKNTANTNFPAQFYIEEESGPATAIQFGVSVGSSNPAYTGFNFSYGTTYLVVIRYDVVAGNNNDNAYIWVNPLLGSEPTVVSANASQLSSNGEAAYGTQLNALQIVQSSATLSPVAAYDAFRVSHGATSLEAWTNLSPQGAALPVQLTSFSAAQDALSNTKLIWNTAEENGIVSYVIEKSADGRNYTAIGTVTAAGQKTYSYTDMQAASEYNYYRLKMVETDGTFKLSYIVSVKSKLSLNISLSPNPTKDKLLIQHPKVMNEGHIQLVNMNGQLIKDLRLPASAVITNIDMSGLANGMYQVVFKSGKDVFSKMVLKN